MKWTLRAINNTSMREKWAIQMFYEVYYTGTTYNRVFGIKYVYDTTTISNSIPVK